MDGKSTTSEVGSGTVMVGAGLAGSAFAITSELVITAAHVLGDATAESVAYAPSDGSSHLSVSEIIRPPRIDVAMLRIAGRTLSFRGAVEPTEGASWVVNSQPRPRDPILDGVITGTTRSISQYGHQADGLTSHSFLQLQVNQHLGDYSGYSGSAVVLSRVTGVAAGILVEQVPQRKVRPGERASATDVLYALPIGTAIGALGIESVVPFVKANALSSSMALEIEKIDKVLQAERESIDTREGRRKDNPKLTRLRSAIVMLDDAVNKTGEGRDSSLRAADSAALEMLSINPHGRTAGIPNSSLVATAHVIRWKVATLEGNPAISHNHMLETFRADPRAARTKWFPGQFQELLSPYCGDIYDEVHGEILRLEDAKQFRMKSVQLYAAAAGLAVGGVALAVILRNAGPLQGVRAGAFVGDLADVDRIRQGELEKVWVRAREKLDQRCRVLVTAMLAGEQPRDEVAGCKRTLSRHSDPLL